jgi:hypothetical protein
MLRLLLTTSMALGCTAVMAIEPVDEAIVTVSQGLPCFSIPESASGSDGLPLHRIVVDSMPSGDWRGLPISYWVVATTNLDSAMLMRHGHCIRFGAVPAGSEQQAFKPLKPFHVYRVYVRAHKPYAQVLGYSAQFCMKPDGRGNMEVHIATLEERRTRNYPGCDAPRIQVGSRSLPGVALRPRNPHQDGAASTSVADSG